MVQPHTPARTVGKDVPEPEDLRDAGYPDAPDVTPGLVGGPGTEAVPGSHRTHAGSVLSDDGGESILSGRPRETGGARGKPGKD
jgi:hypothetical protein